MKAASRNSTTKAINPNIHGLLIPYKPQVSPEHEIKKGIQMECDFTGENIMSAARFPVKVFPPVPALSS